MYNCNQITSKITSIVSRANEEFLLFDPRLLIRNIPEELMKSVGLIEAGLAMGSQVLNPLKSRINRLSLLMNSSSIELFGFNQAVSLGVHIWKK